MPSLPRPPSAASFAPVVRRPHGASIEPLELRRLLAAYISDRTLFVDGTRDTLDGGSETDRAQRDSDDYVLSIASFI